MRFSLSMKDVVRRVVTSSMSHRSEKSAKWAGSRDISPENSREYSSLSICHCSGKHTLQRIYSSVGKKSGTQSGLKRASIIKDQSVPKTTE